MTKTPDSLKFECGPVVVVDPEEGGHPPSVVAATMRVFLCPMCSNTHMELKIPGMRVLWSLPPKAAEELAFKLNCPDVAPESMMGNRVGD